MATNPLQKYFRQPKIFISLPSQGIYSPDAISGDVNRLAVYGMTGMDEIIFKTADALISGESTARIIQSCIPEITDPWSISTLDIDLILSAIRVATYGNEIESTRICPSCSTDNSYTFDLSSLIDFYSTCHYDNTVKIGDLTVVLRPLSYKESTDFSLKNFAIQKQVAQINTLSDEEERKLKTDEVFNQLTRMRQELFVCGIESVSTGNEVVTDKDMINEWLSNSDKEVTDTILRHTDANKEKWTPPVQKAVCTNCGYEEEIPIELDQSNFFASA